MSLLSLNYLRRTSIPEFNSKLHDKLSTEHHSPVMTFFHGSDVKMQKVVTVFRILSIKNGIFLFNFYTRKSGTMWAIHRCS